MIIHIINQMKCCSSVLDILYVPADQKVNHFERKTICRSRANTWPITPLDIICVIDYSWIQHFFAKTRRVRTVIL